ncbi:MAG TPA: phosphoglucosamine mutase [Trueperaceae bacterium]|nr:phosphoglucosamine mutase [Trueperaceae bacterium]
MSSRRFFGTDGVRGVAGQDPMTATFALELGVATAELLKGSTPRPHVLVGMDTRRSGPMLVAALTAGLTSRGIDVTLLGVMTTPGVSYLTRELGADAGIVVSASHNPFADNGLKVFNSDGEKLPDALEHQIEDLMGRFGDGRNAGLEPVTGGEVGTVKSTSSLPAGNTTVKATLGGTVTSESARSEPSEAYIRHLLDNAPYLDGLKVALDCAEGASHAIAPKVFSRLGARLEVSHASPDGQNINVDCGSTHPEFLAKRVVAQGFDVGVTFDGDADRALLIDRRGRIVTGDHVLAICAIARGETEVVATQMSNIGMERYLSERGVTLHRVKVGDRYVFEALKTRGLCLGGEQSGHMLFLDKAPTGDGILTALLTLAAVRQSGKALEQWMDEIPVYPQVLVNVKVPVDQRDRLAEHATVAAAVTAAGASLGSSGRVLLRPSGTEPLVRVMVEGPDQTEVERLAHSVAAAVSATVKA